VSAALPPVVPRAVSPLELTLGPFRGPMDLLLHLVRIDEIDLSDLPILEVARQYDAYVDATRGQQLDTAGEYLVMAASLVHMKSRRLLPPDTLADASALEADDFAAGLAAGDAGDGLQRAAEHLQEREALMELVFPRPAESVAEFAGEQGIEADLIALLRAFQEILKRADGSPEARVTRERISLADRINWLMETLQRDRRIGFRQLFEGMQDRISCILTFLALLEVMRLRLARAFQSHHQEDIIIHLVDDAPPPAAPAMEPRTHA